MIISYPIIVLSIVIYILSMMQVYYLLFKLVDKLYKDKSSELNKGIVSNDLHQVLELKKMTNIRDVIVGSRDISVFENNKILYSLYEKRSRAGLDIAHIDFCIEVYRFNGNYEESYIPFDRIDNMTRSIIINIDFFSRDSSSKVVDRNICDISTVNMKLSNDYMREKWMITPKIVFKDFLICIIPIINDNNSELIVKTSITRISNGEEILSYSTDGISYDITSDGYSKSMKEIANILGESNE